LLSNTIFLVTDEAPSNSTATQPVGGFFDQTPETLRALLESWNEPKYRASQILQWVYVNAATSYEQMTNLPAGLRAKLAASLPIYESTVVREQKASDGTTKRLLQWRDGATTECVLIPDVERNTACISTQVGCPVKCVFCASGLDGLERQLSAGQIIEQAMRIRQLCEPASRLSNIVVMGLGEPLANYSATLGAIRTINADWGLGIGARKMTISTVGLPTQMKRLAEEKLQVTMAISLHAPNDDLRKQLIPWAERVTIADLVDAANYYFEQTGREVTLEYILLAEVNDSEQQAHALAAVARKMRSNVNLIPYNAVAGLPYKRPSESAIVHFLNALRSRGINGHVRRSRGLDIDSACGQLRRREKEQVVALTVESR
jgi:23S rRNA (adenine2503-C2)-methyltransferase